MRLTLAGKGAFLLAGASLAIAEVGPDHVASNPLMMVERLALSAPASTRPPRRNPTWSCWPLM